MKGVSVEYPMYFGAKPDIFKLAKELRKLETVAEKLLWSQLNRNQLLGLQFRRQHPINRFIADFYCPKIKLVIEVDGSQHYSDKGVATDKIRDKYLQDCGLRVLRFNDYEVLTNINGVVENILENMN